MAFLPCMQGPHRTPTRNVNVYVGVLGPETADRTSFRLCLDHWNSIEHDLAEFEVDPVDLTGSPGGYSSKCVTCLQPADEVRRQVFVTAYPAKNERKDYWGKLHDPCRLPFQLEPPLVWVPTR